MIAPRIALRYLFAPKSNAAVNVISLISMAGIAMAAFAMICVLSVFNGFSDLAESRLSAIDPEIKVTRPHGGVMHGGDSIASILKSIDGIAGVKQTIEQRALALTDDAQMPVRVIGIEDGYSEVSSIGDIIIDGDFIDTPDSGCALISIGVAVSTGARPSAERSFILTAPRRLGRINPAFPMAAFRTDTLLVSGVYQTNQGEYDEDLLYIPLTSARALFDYTDEVTSFDLSVADGYPVKKAVEAISDKLGPDFLVADRMRQQEASFRMIQIEKWVTFLMLVLVLIMASFNILSTMSMLIIEKEDNMRILTALGASRSMLRHIFLDEGMLIALIGGTIGLTVGIVMCLIQQHFGLISLGGDPSKLSIAYYPCHPAASDVLITAGVVIVIGFLSGLISSRSLPHENG